MNLNKGNRFLSHVLDLVSVLRPVNKTGLGGMALNREGRPATALEMRGMKADTRNLGLDLY